MQEHYQKQVTRIEEYFASQHVELQGQFGIAFQRMEQDLDTPSQLAAQSVCSPQRQSGDPLEQLHRDAVSDEQKQVKMAEAKSQVLILLGDLEGYEGLIPSEQRTLMRQALDAHLDGLLPNDTPADLVQRFMATNQEYEHAV